jgi:hypothetical protein
MGVSGIGPSGGEQDAAALACAVLARTVPTCSVRGTAMGSETVVTAASSPMVWHCRSCCGVN